MRYLIIFLFLFACSSEKEIVLKCTYGKSELRYQFKKEGESWSITSLNENGFDVPYRKLTDNQFTFGNIVFIKINENRILWKINKKFPRLIGPPMGLTTQRNDLERSTGILEKEDIIHNFDNDSPAKIIKSRYQCEKINKL